MKPAILILSDRVDACKELYRRLALLDVRCGLMLGGNTNKDVLSATIEGLKDGSLQVGIGTSVADEGLDIPNLTHVFVTCPVHKNLKRLNQMIGRCSRPFPGKPEGVCFYFWDQDMFPLATTKKRKKEKDKEFLKSLKSVVDSIDVKT